MKDDVAHQLLDLNQAFYNQFSAPFNRSRFDPMHGFTAALPYLPSGKLTVLDVGCGNGRFSLFMSQNKRLASYTGIDNSEGLLAQAAENFSDLPEPVTFRPVDIRQHAFLDNYPKYDLITHHAVMHHVPQKKMRLTVLQEMAAHLKPDGMLMLSTWQFMDSERQRRKVVDWSHIGLSADDVEASDYLLTWKRSGIGYRYCCMVDAVQTAELATLAGLSIVHQYREDGRERNLSLYTLLKLSI
ncbi:MAG: tRNA (uracil-5-)-methyltransferase TRM9 [Cellvibrionaceae bacterium]|jgi:tRNA (uracil-5-)-methyltransferase TRM9